MSILSIAVLNNDYEAIELLVTHGANVNIQNREDGNTPLHFAAQSNNMTLIKYLIEHGTQVLIKNDDNQYALQHHFILFKNVVDNHGNSMLMHAVKGHDVDLVLSLLQASVSLDIQNADCNTALHIAVLEKQLKIYQLLLQYHADVNIRDCNGKTATQLAEDTSFTVSCKLENVAYQNLLSKSSTTTHVKDEHHKNRHHHGENAIDHRGRRDIDHSWHVFTKDGNHDNDDHLLDARDDIFVVRNAGSSLKPLGNNIVHWIRDSILLFKTLNPIRQAKNLFNEYNDLSLYHELPYWNKSLEEDVEVDDDIADQVPIWIRSTHHINVGNVPNLFIGNDRDKNQVLDDSLCDFQGTLSLWNLLMRKKYGVHYNHQHDIMQSEKVNTESAHRLAYEAYASIYDTSQENIELSGISMMD